jgi:heme oxygenase (mycobilin-producing)
MTVIVTNRIPVAEGHNIDFEERFRRRVHLVDQSPGFIRNEVHRPRPMRFDRDTGEWTPNLDKQGHYEVKTWWRSMDAFIAWTRSESFRLAHADRPPKEMFSGPPEIVIHEIVTSTDLDTPSPMVD